VRRSACERVTLRELLVGRLSFGSRLPQYLERVIMISTGYGVRYGHRLAETWSYLTTAIFTGAVVLAR
jgi:hypothetical protein